MDPKFMRAAIEEAMRGVEAGDGGPFGAAVVRDGTVIAVGHNEVVAQNDPTAHAEILAIREACRSLGTFDLSGCEIFSTCEPCPMCLAAIHWARISGLWWGASRHDAAAIGFDDLTLYETLAGRRAPAFESTGGIQREACLGLMHDWNARTDKVPY